MRLFNLKKLSVKRKIVEQRMLQQLLKKNEYLLKKDRHDFLFKTNEAIKIRELYKRNLDNLLSIDCCCKRRIPLYTQPFDKIEISEIDPPFPFRYVNK